MSERCNDGGVEQDGGFFFEFLLVDSKKHVAYNCTCMK